MIARFDGQTSRSRWSVPGMALTALLGAVALTGAVSAQDHPGGAAAAPPATVSQPGPGQNTTLRLEDAAAIAAAQAQIKAAEAELQVQKADLNRFMQLSRSNAVSVGDVEKAKASVVRAEAQVEVAKANLAAEEAKAGAAVQAASPPAEGGAAAVAPGNAAPDGGIEDADARDADARARESLHKAIAVKFDGVGLGDALDFLRDKTGVDLVIDAHSLESIGVDRNAPVTLTLERPVPGDQALRWILRMASPECAFTVDHGVVFVSARDQVSHMTVTRAYTVDDLVGEANGRTPAELVELIQQFVAHETWRDTGGETGAIRSFANKILVTQTEPNHREIEKLLDLLRKDERGGKTGVAIPTAPPIDPSPTRSLPGAP